eukprot:Hpha_TRINITY_DN10488_c0_g1::TRINITY_DN10488_c0_g1_i1::g.193281::m.193281
MGCCDSKQGHAGQPRLPAPSQPRSHMPPDAYWHQPPPQGPPQHGYPPQPPPSEYHGSRQRARPPPEADRSRGGYDYAIPPQQAASRGGGPAPPQHRSPARDPRHAPPPLPALSAKMGGRRRPPSFNHRAYGVGERVDAVWDADGFWYAAWVTASRKEEASCGIVFDDLVEVDRQPLQQVRPRFARGERVECRWMGGPDYYRGAIDQVRGDGVYSIFYDDGDYEHSCPCHLIRVAREPSALSKGPLPPPGFFLMRLASSGRIVKGRPAGSGRGGAPPLVTSYGHTIPSGGGGARRD